MWPSPATLCDRAPLDRQAFAGCSFAIEHFGATVPYWTEGFCDRNVDTFDKELLALMTECAANRHAEFTRDLFSQPVPDLSPPSVHYLSPYP